jgi:hypothetical protein
MQRRELIHEAVVLRLQRAVRALQLRSPGVRICVARLQRLVLWRQRGQSRLCRCESTAGAGGWLFRNCSALLRICALLLQRTQSPISICRFRSSSSSSSLSSRKPRFLAFALLA